MYIRLKSDRLWAVNSLARVNGPCEDACPAM